jgi:hypothetical protein
MQFHLGDEVREGARLGTVTDVGTMLIQVKTTTGASRMVCPWELVRLGPSPERFRSNTAPL